jgi:hypothetical protein
MAGKFHIKPDGTVAPCKATKGRCPFGGDDQHYPSKEAANEAFQKIMEWKEETKSRYEEGLGMKLTESSDDHNLYCEDGSILVYSPSEPVKTKEPQKWNSKVKQNLKKDFDYETKEKPYPRNDVFGVTKDETLDKLEEITKKHGITVDRGEGELSKEDTFELSRGKIYTETFKKQDLRDSEGNKIGYAMLAHTSVSTKKNKDPGQYQVTGMRFLEVDGEKSEMILTQPQHPSSVAPESFASVNESAKPARKPKFNAQLEYEDIKAEYGEVSSEMMDDFVKAGVYTRKQAEEIYESQYK